MENALLVLFWDVTYFHAFVSIKNHFKDFWNEK